MNSLKTFSIVSAIAMLMTVAVSIIDAQSVFADRQTGINRATGNVANVQANANVKAQDVIDVERNDVAACVIVDECNPNQD